LPHTSSQSAISPLRVSDSNNCEPNSTSAPALPRTYTAACPSNKLRIFSSFGTCRPPMMRSCAASQLGAPLRIVIRWMICAPGLLKSVSGALGQ
jgi:hypothetical protein